MQPIRIRDGSVPYVNNLSNHDINEEPEKPNRQAILDAHRASVWRNATTQPNTHHSSTQP